MTYKNTTTSPAGNQTFQIQKFNHAQFSEITTLTARDGKIWFVGNEVAAKMGYASPKDAVSVHCKGAVNHRLLTTGGNQSTKIIPEQDLYRLIMRSKLETAEDFQDWVCGEVLPSIRETGRYDTKQTARPASLPESVDALMIAVRHAAEILRVSDVSKSQMVHRALELSGLPTGVLPAYVENVRVTFSATDLLKKNSCAIGVRAFNKLLIEAGYLETKTRTASKGKTKEYKSVTEKGLRYGQNDASAQNSRETQPHWFEDTFMELYRIVAGV
jgi:prophage antirepressor-like protein